MRDEFDPQAEAAELQSQEDKAKLKRQQQIDDIKWLMAHAAGRRFVSR